MKNLTLTFCLLCLSYFSKAQNQFIGIQAGLNLSTIHGDDIFDDSKILPGLNAGLSYEILLMERFSLGANIEYNQRGYQYEVEFRDENNNDLGSYNVIVRYSYLSVPLKIGYSFGDKFRITPKVGFMASFVQDAFYKLSDIPPTLDVASKVSIDNSRSTIIQGLVELALDYPINDRFVFSSAINSNNAFNTILEEGADQYHIGINLNIGLKYSI